MIMYQVNDVVVFRRKVCRVIGKEKSDFTGEMCYVLEPYNAEAGQSVRMLVPVSNKGGHLRSLATKQEIDDLCRRADDVELLESKPANMKSLYAAIMKGDSLDELVSVIKTSYLRNHERALNHKKLASIDEEYLKKAADFLYSEMSVALGIPYEDCADYFRREVAKSLAEKKAA